jgi:hypothetical protein
MQHAIAVADIRHGGVALAAQTVQGKRLLPSLRTFGPYAVRIIRQHSDKPGQEAILAAWSLSA